MRDRYTVGRSVGRGVLWGSLLGGLLVAGALNPSGQPATEPADRPAHAWCDQGTYTGVMALNTEIQTRLQRQLDLHPTRALDATAIRADVLNDC